MFEKEAEKWTIDYVCKDCSRYKECKSKEHCTCKECSKEKWQNGAEFGYNKCKEELNQKGLALQSDMDETIEQNIAHKKENAELKEENTELKTKKIPQLERKIASIRGCHSVAVKKLNARIEQVERLKKENAELRQKLRSKL